jgi:hypothetical protein
VSHKICVDPDFFDLELYAVYHIIYDYIREEAWNVVWKAGEIVLNEISGELGLDEVGDPFTALKKLASWLKKVGYIEDIDVKKIGDDSVEYKMLRPIIERCAKRLIKEGRVPPHISTALMFALLDKYGYKAEMMGDPVFQDDGYVVERWRLSKK